MKNANNIIIHVQLIIISNFLGCSVTIDERMISWQGRSNLVKYEPMKPTKWGFKPYVLADKNRYSYHTSLIENLENDETLTKTEKLVKDMMEMLDPNKVHILATDSFYTGEKLCSLPFAFIGNIKKNRLSLLKEEKELKIEKGSALFLSKRKYDTN